ncbi:MAG: response regulator transcription factor [Bacteroidales bacterium]|jgi:DNA-binding response OmpR family regulator|nr:response regulator transcription factor [Bacteroidales bacterium]
MKRILIAEDDSNLGMVLSSYLTLKGFTTALCDNGEDAYNEFLKGNYDLCLIDIMIPLKDGYSLVENIRKVDGEVPIFFMSAKSMQEDVLKGFSLNADDYLIKPFSMEELLMRIKAILRRTSQTEGDEKQVFQIGDYVFDNNVQQLIYKGDILKLTSKESALLYVLCEKMGKIVNRTYILNRVWDKNDYYNARSMDVYITKLRKFLKKDPNVNLLNIHGVGFKLAISEKRTGTTNY